MVLVDTCIWIDFLRGRSTAAVDLLTQLLEDGEASLCEIIFTEICWGSKDKSQLKKYKDHFGGLPFLVRENDWGGKVMEMGFQMKQTGFRPFIADLMIAEISISKDVDLLTSDRDFLPMVKLFDLKLNLIK